MSDNYPYHSLVRPGFQMDFPSITLLTDFGERDGFVGVMKGVIYAQLIQPVPIIDLSHQIEPQNLRQAMWILETSYAYFSAKTVFVAVVDPAVGSPNQAALLAYWPQRQQVFIAPNNGLLTPILEAAGPELQVYDIRRSVAYQRNELSPKPRSQTFHGRDVYAPIAACVTNAFLNEDQAYFSTQFLAQFGSPLEEEDSQPLRLIRQKPTRIEEGNALILQGEIVASDRFGNLITNLPATWAPPRRAFIRTHWPARTPRLSLSGNLRCGRHTARDPKPSDASAL